jgi:hypothetical protein
LHNPIFFLSISSSWVNIRLHTKNQLYTLSGSSLKVCVVGGWWVVVGGGVESELSDQLCLWPSRIIDKIDAVKKIYNHKH